MTRADRIRSLRGLDKEKLDAFDPARAVYKLGRGWYYSTALFASAVGPCKTKREAIGAATAHKRLLVDQYENPETWFDLTSLIAGEHLRIAKGLMADGMSEREAFNRAEELIPSERD